MQLKNDLRRRKGETLWKKSNGPRQKQFRLADRGKKKAKVASYEEGTLTFQKGEKKPKKI